MGRRAGSPKGKAKAKRSAARKSPKSEGARVRDLEKRLAESLEREKAKDRALTEALEQQTATAEILGVISSSQTDLQPVMDAVAQNAARVCNAADASIFRLDGDVLRRVAQFGLLPHSMPIMPLTREIPTARSVIDRQTIHIADVQSLIETEFPGLRPNLPAQQDIHTVLATPLMREGAPIGAILIRRTQVQPFTGKQVDLLKTFADQAVIAIENVRLFTELQGKNLALTKAHAQVSEALDRQTATSEILRVISSSPTDVQPIFDEIVESAVRLCEARYGAVFNFDGELVHLVAHHNFTDIEPLEALRKPYPMRPNRAHISGRAILSGSVVQIPDIARDPEYGSPLAIQAGFRSLLAVPVLRDGAPIGAIVIYRLEPGLFPERHISLLQTFADQAVIAIENVRLFRELQEKNRALTQAHAEVSDALARQTATSDVLRIISRSQTDLKPVFGAIMQAAVRLCAADLGGIFRVEDAQLVPVEFSPDTADTWKVIGQAFPRPVDTTSLLGRAVVEARVLHVPDVQDPQAPHGITTVSRGLSFRSQLSVPIVRDGQPIGAIGLSRREPGPFSDAAIDLVKTFADQAVIAIENARLLAELRARTQELTRSVDELTALGDVSRALSSTLDLDAVLQTIVTRASQLAGTDACSVFEYDEATEAFHLRATHNLDDEVVALARQTPVRKGEGVQGRMALTRQPVQVPDIAAEDAYRGPLRDILLRTGTRAVLAVPMLREGELIGGLTVNKRTPGEFSPEVIELLTTFATQSALAIQNARLFREIADKSRQLEAASQHKSEFLANMSHELRTPLNAVIGFSEVLSEGMFGQLNEKQEEYARDIYSSGQHLLSLINDILDLSKIEAGRMELEAADFDLPSAIDNALTLVRERATRRGITLGRTIDDRLGMLRGDERKVKQVLLNLLSNALKFTPEGGRIDVSAHLRDGAAQIAVADTGVGIAPEDQEAIFEEFRQVGTADKKVEGTGLGLALSRKFIELHGGRIWVQSEVGHGSTFTFTLPMS